MSLSQTTPPSPFVISRSHSLPARLPPACTTRELGNDYCHICPLIRNALSGTLSVTVTPGLAGPCQDNALSVARRDTEILHGMGLTHVGLFRKLLPPLLCPAGLVVGCRLQTPCFLRQGTLTSMDKACLLGPGGLEGMLSHTHLYANHPSKRGWPWHTDETRFAPRAQTTPAEAFDL